MNLHEIPDPEAVAQDNWMNDFFRRYPIPPVTAQVAADTPITYETIRAAMRDVFAGDRIRARGNDPLFFPPRRAAAHIETLILQIRAFHSAMQYSGYRGEQGRVAFVVTPEEYRELQRYRDMTTYATPVEYSPVTGTMRVHGVTVIPR